jgi:hypothetical protein
MRDLWKNEEGSVVVLVTVSMFALFGFAALALDAGYWFDRSTRMSNVADLSAVSGAKIAVPIDLANPNSAASVAASKTNIQTVANANLGGAVVAGNIVFGCWNQALVSFTPNSNCAAAGPGTVVAANAVGVKSADPSPQSFFARVFGVDPLVVPNATTDLTTLQNPANCTASPNKCYAVAFREFNLQSCLITMSTEKDSLYVNGDINLNMPNCGIHVNGGIDGSNNDVDVDTPYLCANGDIKNPYLEDAADNYCGIMSKPPGPTYTLPTAPANGNVQINNGESQTYSGSGTFTKLDVNQGGTATLNDGKYVFTGNITVQGTLNANNATIILKNGATINVQGTGQIPTLTAPTTGDTAGYALIENCTTSCSGTSSLGGNSTLDYQGNIYLPSQTLELRGTPGISSISTSIIVYELEMKGTADWSNVTMNPSGSGPLLPTQVHLVQ